MKPIYAALIGVGIGVILTLLVKGCDKTEPVIETRTEVKIDTIYIDKPVYAERKVIDTMCFYLVDTLISKDTITIREPVEQRTYFRDSMYRAVVSGVKPSLDWIEVYPRTETITKYIQVNNRHWGLGVQAGVGVGFNGKPIISPYIGVGVSYNFLQW